eukprot:4439850-Amphidinium_carterae.1
MAAGGAGSASLAALVALGNAAKGGSLTSVDYTPDGMLAITLAGQDEQVVPVDEAAFETEVKRRRLTNTGERSAATPVGAGVAILEYQKL